MATYKVWLTVKDSSGKTKEIDGGTLDVDLSALTQDEISQIEEALPLEEYLKKANIDQELGYYATDSEVDTALKNQDAIRYGDFELNDGK